jgi:hypothetical protein
MLNRSAKHGYYLRPNRTRDYSHCFTLLSIASSVKIWGEKAVQAIKDELQMLLYKRVFEFVRRLTMEQTDKDLCIHCFTVEKKRSGQSKSCNR